MQSILRGIQKQSIKTFTSRRALSAMATADVVSHQFHHADVALSDLLDKNPVTTDNYEWPTLYEAADEMLDASLLMYLVAELRRIAREPSADNFQDAEAVLKEPITAREVGDLLDKHLDKIQEFFKEDEVEVLSDVMDAIVARQQERRGSKPATATLVNFSDDNTAEELVYAIGFDDSRKRITVSFRGSVTKTDWFRDAQIWMEELPNPLFTKQAIHGQPETLRVHNGFYEYLCYPAPTGKVRSDGTRQSHYQSIVNQVNTLLKEKPGYKLFVTGHSLGAALASLFAFLAAANDDINTSTVNCVSIASPYVGGSNFKAAFQYLEKTERLRYLRVANQNDLVTVMPFFAPNMGMYKHVGMELKLFENDSMLTYPDGRPVQRYWYNSLFSNLSIRPATNHSATEYSGRLEKAKDDLNTTRFDELYGS